MPPDPIPPTLLTPPTLEWLPAYLAILSIHGHARALHVAKIDEAIVDADPSRWFRFWEQPIDGCRYLITCDSSKGRKEHVTSRIPDRQSVLVLRAACTDRFTCNQKPAVVGRIIPACEYRIERVAPLVAYLSLFYGNCTVCVEENNTGLALLALLKRDGVPLYRRREGLPDHPKFEDGFYTETHTRRLIIGEGRDAITKKGWDIWCPHLLAELQTFVKKPDGREEAEGTLKDDDVMAWLIGRRCLPSGTVYKERVRGTAFARFPASRGQLGELMKTKRVRISIPTLGGIQEMSFVTESGLFTLSLGSRKSYGQQ